MKDQDEMFEAATETPIGEVKVEGEGEQRNIPLLPKLPSGFDGTEPLRSVRRSDPTVVGRDVPGAPDVEEMKKRGAKLKASNDRSYEKMNEIERIANECIQRTTHAEYEPGQYGQDYRTFGRAMCEIRRICKQSFAEEIVLDYEWLAKIMTSDHFKPECLAKAIEAEASKRPIEYPTFYTPGWLVELAKKLGAEDKAAKQKEYFRKHFYFCDGLFPIRRANSEKSVVEHCWIGGRRFTMELTQDIHDDGEHVCCAKIRDNSKLVAKLAVYRGKSMAEHMAHAAFKEYVNNLSGSKRFSSRGGFLKQAIKRLSAKQKAHDNKADAAREGK